jgi:hypothetical protein
MQNISSIWNKNGSKKDGSNEKSIISRLWSTTSLQRMRGLSRMVRDIWGILQLIMERLDMRLWG